MREERKNWHICKILVLAKQAATWLINWEGKKILACESKLLGVDTFIYKKFVKIL
jgi:hypothetical protein